MTGRLNLEPFASAGYRRWFVGATLASLAIWAYQPALEWIVLTQTGLAGAVGLLQTAMIVGVAVATLPSGFLTERFGARGMVALSLVGIGVMVALVAGAAATNRLSFEVALILTLVLGIFDGLYGVPAALLLGQLVEPKLLGSAIGLSYLASGVGRLIGGPIGGATLQGFGAAAAFLPAAAVLGISAVVILRTPVHHVEERHDRTASGADLREAVRWLARRPAALWVTVLATVSGLSVFCYSALLPAYTRDVLRADAATLGLLAGAGGLGVIVGALLMEPIGRRIGRGRQLVGMFLACAATLALLALTDLLIVALGLAVAITVAAIQFGGSAQFVIQAMPPPRVRARVVAVYTFAYYCSLPIGTAAAGALADAIGVRAVLLGMAGLTAASAAVVLVAYPAVLSIDTDAKGQITVGRSSQAARPVDAASPSAPP